VKTASISHLSPHPWSNAGGFKIRSDAVLDAAIKEQLKEVFSKLTAVVTLRVSNSAHH
jgi:hypothetical protein